MSSEALFMEIEDTDSDDADYSPESSISSDDIFTEELDSSATDTDEDASDVPPLSNSDNEDLGNDNNSNDDDEEMSSEQTESNSASPEPQVIPIPELPVSVPLESVLPFAVAIFPQVEPGDVIADAVKGASPNAEVLNHTTEEDGQMCTICFEPWTNSSEHRLVSLKCGHLFGQSCITRWLKSTSKAKCPQCNTSAKKNDIRPIYARTLKVLDTSERDRALQQLEKETELKGKLQIEFTQVKLKYQMAMQECDRLRKELVETKALLHEFRSSQGQTEKPTQHVKSNSQLILMKSLELCKQGGCRIMDFCGSLSMMIVSQPSTNHIFKGFGLRKIFTEEMRATDFVCVHQKSIKDVSFRNHDGLVLSASLDKTVKLTSLLNNSVVQSYSLENDVWSCTWNKDDPRYFYAGVRNGGVFEFDIRMTNSHVCQLPNMGQTSPVVALQHLSKLNSSSYNKSGPIVGHLSGCCFYEKEGDESTYKLHPLPLEGNFTSLSCDQGTGYFLVSCRPSFKHPQVTHTLCSFRFDDGDPVPCTCDKITTLYGGSTQVQLAKSRLFPSPQDKSTLLVCSGDEDAKGALIWNACTGDHVQTLTADSPVLDLASCSINHQSIFATLTERNLRLYAWKDS